MQNLNLKNNPFESVSRGFSIPDYNIYLTNNHIIQTSNSTILPENDVFESSESKQKNQSFGKKVLYSMLGIGAVVLMLTRGISGSVAAKIKAKADKVENEFLKSASKNKATAFVYNVIADISKRTRKLFSLSSAIANITSIKDTAAHKFTSWDFLLSAKSDKFKFPRLHKFLNKYLPLQKFCDFMTKHVLKITESAVDSKYKKAGNALEMLEADLRNILSKLNPSSEKASRIKALLDAIAPNYQRGFGKSARLERINAISEGIKNLDKDVCKAIISPFKKDSPAGTLKKVYSKYITQSIAEPVQTLHKNSIDIAKRALSYDIADVGERLNISANELKYCFNPKDLDSRLLLGDLLQKFENFKNLPSSANLIPEGSSCKLSPRKILENEILSALDSIKANLSSFSYAGKNGKTITYSAEELQKASELINSMKNTVTNSHQKGLLQEIVTEMKGVLSEKEYLSLKDRVSKANSILNEAVELEGNNMFNKMAEAKVGSIVTDMAGIGLMAAGGALAISSGKDKNEKVGATLKVGVPLVGVIATYFYSAARAFSGTTNLLFSALAGYILNKIGSSVYDYYQKRFVENKPVGEIVQTAYNKATNI